MNSSGQDTHWMRRALELARRGIGVTSPNPAVGCVLLDRAGQIVGEGWHEYDLLDHAEIVALRWVPPAYPATASTAARPTSPSSPATITGRTPPCTDALIKSGLARVVAATIDPNPAVAGQGLAALRAAGIQTSVGVCQTEARRLNEGFARWIQHRRPFVLMKVAMTLDARIAPPPAQQTPHAPYWITSEVARAAVQQLRWAADATMVGVDTVLADDPWMTDRSGLRRRRPLLRIVLDSALRMPLDSKLVSTAQNDVVVFTVSNDEARAAELRNRGVRVEVLPAEAGRVPLDKVSRQARRRRRPHPPHRNRHAPQHRLSRRRPRRPPPPLHLAADHGLRRSPRLPRHVQLRPHGRCRSRALRQRPRPQLAPPRPLAASAES